MNNIINYAGEDFENEIISHTGLTLVDFYAIWCECRIARVDVDDYPEFGTKFKIRGLPMLILFKDGEIVETLNGFQTFDEIMKKINLHS